MAVDLLKAGAHLDRANKVVDYDDFAKLSFNIVNCRIFISISGG